MKGLVGGPGAVHKNNSVSGRPAGWLKKVRLETPFYFIFYFFYFFPPKNGQYFHGKKKSGKKKDLRLPDWLQL